MPGRGRRRRAVAGEPRDGGLETGRAHRRAPRSRRACGRASPPLAHRPPTNSPAEVGHDRARQAQGARPARRPRPRSGGRRPRSTVRSITMRSRSGSMAGLVTWAKLWRRWSATGRSSRAAAGGRRVVAHAPQGLVRLEGHGLDVQPRPLGVHADQVAATWCGGAGPDGRRPAASGGVLLAPAAARRGAAASAAPGLGVGVLADDVDARRPRAGARPARGGRDGSVSAASNGTAPPSEATATRPVAVTANEAGRSPLRSSIAPTVAVAEHERRRTVPGRQEPRGPSSQRRDVRAAGPAQAERLGDGHQEGRVQVPAGRGEELEPLVEGQRVGTIRARAAGRRRGARSRCGAPRSRGAPRTCSRLPRTVLISPLWAMARNGWASRHIGWVFVA